MKLAEKILDFNKEVKTEVVNENSKNNGKEIADLGKKLLKETDKEKILEGLDLLLVHMSFVLRDIDEEAKMTQLRKFRDQIDL